MARLSASSRMKAWTLDANGQPAATSGNRSRQALTDYILDRDGESRVCSWKCGGTGGVARLFMMASCGCGCPNLKDEEDAGRESWASTVSQRPPNRKVADAVSADSSRCLRATRICDVKGGELLLERCSGSANKTFHRRFHLCCRL
jgi:hypothetical protein